MPSFKDAGFWATRFISSSFSPIVFPAKAAVRAGTGKFKKEYVVKPPVCEKQEEKTITKTILVRIFLYTILKRSLKIIIVAEIKNSASFVTIMDKLVISRFIFQ